MSSIPPFRIFVLAAFLLVPGLAWAAPISGDGEKMKSFLDSLQVEQHWVAGRHVDWRTGEPDGRPVSATGPHSHCSAFAAAACDRLGIYLLHPPEHSQIGLANAQYDWLINEGAAHGWKPVQDGEAAQRLANQGAVVVAVFKEPDPTKHGHIAIVYPADLPDDKLRLDGPEITQAGMENYSATSLHTGFKHHAAALASNGIRYFAHDVRDKPAAK